MSHLTAVFYCGVSVLLLLLGAPPTRAHIPPRNETARVARFVAHHCDWGALATISSHEPVRGQPFANVFSISDGPRGHGSGVPYFYLTTMEISVQDLQDKLGFYLLVNDNGYCDGPRTPRMDISAKMLLPQFWNPSFLNLAIVTPRDQENANASLTMSLAQTPYCREKHYDPQSPLCAHIILSGIIEKVDEKENATAKHALFSRHPEMVKWPHDHNWFFAKLNITNIWVLDYFGGIKTVTPDEYYKAKPWFEFSEH